METLLCSKMCILLQSWFEMLSFFSLLFANESFIFIFKKLHTFQGCSICLIFLVDLFESIGGVEFNIRKFKAWESLQGKFLPQKSAVLKWKLSPAALPAYFVCNNIFTTHSTLQKQYIYGGAKSSTWEVCNIYQK